MSKENKQPQMTLGETLKKAREKKGLHIENISRETRISKSILQSLEQDRLDDLPQKIYVIGFIKTYARLLELDEQECIEKFEILYNGEAVKTDLQDNESVVLQGQKESANYSSKLLLVIPLLIIAVALILLSKPKDTALTEKESVQPQLEETNSTLSTKLTVTEVQEKKLEPKTAISQEFVKDQPKTVKKEDIKKETVKISQTNEVKKDKPKIEKPKDEAKEDKKKIKFSPMPYPLYSIDKNASEDILNQLPEHIKSQLNKNLQNVYITANGADSWLTYQKDQGEIYKYILRDGKDLFLQAEQIKMFIGNVRTTQIFLNNQPLKVTSRSGVKSLVFPQAIAKEMVLPLFIFNKKDGSVKSSEQYLEENSATEEDI